jgi:DNA-binding transcriptional ArsR family regulator
MELVGYEERDSERLDVTFAALADPTRRAILARLATGEATVTELARPFAMSQPAISKHLKVLERAGLVSRSRDAQRRPCRLEARPLASATAWLEDYRSRWEERYRNLDALLDELQAGGDDAPVRSATEPRTNAVNDGEPEGET